MDPRNERQVERLCGLLDRLLERDFLKEHDQIKNEIILLRNDVNRIIERAVKLEEQSENTGSIYLSDLREKLKAREEGGDKWIRYVVATFVTLLFMGISVLLGYVAPHH